MGSVEVSGQRTRGLESRLSCDRCKDIQERTDVPHVVTHCDGCGRELRIVRPGKYGKGLRLEKGDKITIPKDWMRLSVNPLKGRGRFTRAGLGWYAQRIFVDTLPKKEEEYPDEAQRLEDLMDETVAASPLLAERGLDPNREEDVEEIASILSEHPESIEYWAFLTGMFLAMAREARSMGDAAKASWASACAERCHAMVVYREHLHEVVWMGHSARRIIEVLRTWDARRSESAEGFWQETFNTNSYVLSQVFAVPVLFIQDNAYLGGMKLDRRDAKFVDYLFSAESSREAILVEIKTPTTRLLGQEYRRNTFAPSADLAGSVVQVLSYRTELVANLEDLVDGGAELRAFRPKCVLIAGNAGVELDDAHKRKSFELFRGSVDVEIVTYDELFRKVEILAELFSLKRTGESEGEDVPKDGNGA